MAERVELKCSASPLCRRPAAKCCFECDEPYCLEHVTLFQFRLVGTNQRFSVCYACLVAYLEDPDRRRMITILTCRAVPPPP